MTLSFGPRGRGIAFRAPASGGGIGAKTGKPQTIRICEKFKYLVKQNKQRYLEVRFVKWADVVGHEWKGGRLAIMFRGIPKKVTIRDRDGDINRLLEGVYFT